jgi:predicted nucleotidyltransferase
MISTLIERNIAKIIALFLLSPGSKYTRKEIKEKTGMNNVPLDKALKKLLKTEMLKEEKNLLGLNPAEPEEAKKLKEIITADYRDKLNFVTLKIFYIILEASDKLSCIKEVKELVLFGSYAKLIYSEKSDIDFAVFLDKKIKNKEKTERKILKEMSKIEKRHKKKIEIHFFSEEDKKHKEDPLIKDILKNGRKIF